jgi:hypothetical protein
MKQIKYPLIAQKIGQIFGHSVKKKIIIYLQWFRSYTFFNEALQHRFFAKKNYIGQK